jgi:uncharacterized membrane protein YdjX (TVP38/TMEM64 family)
MGGVLFGWIAGAAAALAGATFGATILFLVIRKGFAASLARRAGPRISALLRGFRRDAFSYILFLRVVLVFPFWMVNLAAALCGIAVAPFIAATALGMVPASIAFALFGAGLESALRAQETAYRTCLAAGRADCRLVLESASQVFTPQLIAGLAALALMALAPVLLRGFSRRPPLGTSA